MTATAEKERVKTGLDEVRSLVLGAQILLGFQYRAGFESAFASLPPAARVLQVVAMTLLVASLTLFIAPAPYHRIAAAGQARVMVERYTKVVALAALVPFALALAADFGVALARQLGVPGACALGAAAAAAALTSWFGPGLASRGKPSHKEDEMVPVKDRITALLTESRIVLPGVQALLGFQFASYLTQGFETLSHAGKAVNTASLLMLVTAMVLLMALAPYHQLAENGGNTERFERVAERLMLAALVPLALGIAGDVFVVTEVVLGTWAGAALALICAAGMAAFWFGVPLLAARRSQA